MDIHINSLGATYNAPESGVYAFDYLAPERTVHEVISLVNLNKLSNREAHMIFEHMFNARKSLGLKD